MWMQDRLRVEVFGHARNTGVFLFSMLIFFAMPADPIQTQENASAQLTLEELIAEALENNPEMRAAAFRAEAFAHRVSQVESLPDPMLMLGYQNEGWQRYTFGEMPDSQWMISYSQMLPYPGKRSLGAERAAEEAESLKSVSREVRLQTISRIKEIYHELFLAHKSRDLIREKEALFASIEDAALARYSTGTAPQQELLMAQTEKYMLREQDVILGQKIASSEAMLGSALGREGDGPLGRPADPVPTTFTTSLDELLNTAESRSPRIQEKKHMLASAEAMERLSRKEYYPDFTLTGTVMKKEEPFEDMWSLSVGVNLPIFLRSRQQEAVYEAQASLRQSEQELKAARFSVMSSIRDNFAMVKAAEGLMDLYKRGLIVKSRQDFELALSGYVTGRVEAITVITRLKSLLDYELLYHERFAEREKAIARLEALSGWIRGGLTGAGQ